MSTTENLVQKLPSNQKIEKGIENVRQEIHAVRTAPGLDTTGHRILTDTEQVLSSAETLLREKNEGDKLQRIIKEGQKATAELQQQAKELRSTGAPSIDTDRLRELAERTLETARLAGIELISSNSFRRTLGDFLLLCYDIIADTTTDTAHKVSKKKKGQTKLESPPSKTSEAATAPSPFSLSTPSTTTPAGQPSSAAPSSTTAGPAKMSYASVAGGGGRAGETSIAGAAPTSTPTTTTSTTGGDSLKDQAKEGLETAINKGLSAAGTDQRVRLSKEQIDQLVNRFIDLMRNIGQRERTKKVFVGLMDMFKLFGQQLTEGYTATGDSVMNKAERSAAAMRYNKHVMRTLNLSRELFEQFAGEKSMDALIYHLRKVDKSVRKDKETRAYFRELRSYMNDILDRPELIDDAETGRRGRRLIKRGRRLHDKKLWVHLRGILDESKNILHNIQSDPATRALKNDMKRLIQDIMLDEKGNVVLKENVLNQLRLILVSSVIERMRFPMPTIRMEDESMAYTIKNLVVSIRDLVPEKVVIENRGRLSLDLGDVRSPGVEEASNTIRLVIENINIHMEQADIKFHRKTFPKVMDKGKLRMDIGGRGMDLVIQLQTYAGSRDVFRVQFVDCDVHNLDFYLQDTRHDWLYNSVLKLLSGRIKRGMENNIENNLRNHLEGLNRMLLKQIRKSKGLTKKGGLLEGGGAPSLTSVLKSGANVLTGGADILS